MSTEHTHDHRAHDHQEPHHRGGDAPAHEHGHDHPDEHRHGGLKGLLTGLFRPHSHDAADSVDNALAGSAEGIRTVKISLVVLGATALLQLVVVLTSGSVALLADTIHNFADASTALPLWLAFSVSRRSPTRR